MSGTEFKISLVDLRTIFPEFSSITMSGIFSKISIINEDVARKEIASFAMSLTLEKISLVHKGPIFAEFTPFSFDQTLCKQSFKTLLHAEHLRKIHHHIAPFHQENRFFLNHVVFPEERNLQRAEIRLFEIPYPNLQEDLRQSSPGK